MGRKAGVRLRKDRAEPARRGKRPLEHGDPQVVVWRGVNGQAVRFGDRPDVVLKEGPILVSGGPCRWSRRTEGRIHRRESSKCTKPMWKWASV